MLGQVFAVYNRFSVFDQHLAGELLFFFPAEIAFVSALFSPFFYKKKRSVLGTVYVLFFFLFKKVRNFVFVIAPQHARKLDLFGQAINLGFGFGCQ